MTWLYSLYWLAAVAAAGPVLFHMWRRIPRGERYFSTLMFLSPSPPRLTSRSKIEHWLLLLLRCAAIVFITIAFTRPLWRIPFSQADQINEEKRLAVLIDTSASMRRDGLWNDLLDRLDHYLADIPLETSVALYRFDHEFSPVLDFRELKSLEPAARRALAVNRLKELKPTWQDTQLGEALVRTATALQDEQAGRTKAIKQQILLASDLQAGCEIIALQGYEWPEEISVELLSLKPVSPSNAGLQVVDRQAESRNDALRVRVTNSPDSLKQQFTLRWAAPESPEITIYVPPGQSRVLMPPALPEGISSTSLILSGDDHDFDNQVYVTETLPEQRTVVYCGQDSANDSEGSRFFLEKVLKASRQFQVELVEPMTANIASADSQPALIVLIDPTTENQSLIRRHLDQGGAILVASPTAEAMTASLALCGCEGFQVTEATIHNYAMLSDINFDHPLFAPFMESRFSNFTGIRFWKHRSLRGPAAVSENGNEPGGTFRVLARFDDGDPAIVQFPTQRGNVIAFASSWRPSDSQLARSSKFPMLMFRLLEQSTGATARQGHQSVGNPLAWPTTNRIDSTSTGAARLPDGTELSSLPLNLPFTKTDAPGLYSLSVPGRTERIAVNLAAHESRTAPMTVEQLESHGLRLKARDQAADAKAQLAYQRQLQLIELEQSQKLWQKALLIVLLLLFAESFLSSWFSAKQETSSTGSTELLKDAS